MSEYNRVPEFATTFPSLVIDFNQESPHQSLMRALVYDGRQFEHKIDLGQDVIVRTSDRGSQRIQVAETATISPTILRELERFMVTGNASDNSRLQYGRQEADPVTRKVILTHQDDPTMIYVANGFGLGRADEVDLVFTPPTGDLEGVNEILWETSGQRMGTTYVQKDGTYLDTLDHSPPGAYGLGEVRNKVKNTRRAHMFKSGAHLPEVVMWGTYPEIKRRSHPVGWMIYRQPRTIDHGSLAQLSVLVDHLAAGTYETHESQFIFESHVLRTSQALRKIAKYAAHFQMHPGNIGMDIRDSLPFIGDWETMRLLQRYNTEIDPNAGFSAKTMARAFDLGRLLNESLTVYKFALARVGKGMDDNEIKRILTFGTFGYLAPSVSGLNREAVSSIANFVSGVYDHPQLQHASLYDKVSYVAHLTVDQVQSW